MLSFSKSATVRASHSAFLIPCIYSSLYSLCARQWTQLDGAQFGDLAYGTLPECARQQFAVSDTNKLQRSASASATKANVKKYISSTRKMLKKNKKEEREGREFLIIFFFVFFSSLATNQRETLSPPRRTTQASRAARRLCACTLHKSRGDPSRWLA